VGFGRSETANVSSHLADLLDIRALDDDFRLARRLDRNAFRAGLNDRMGEPEREVQSLSLSLRAVPDADEFELALVALAHAMHEVGEVRARRARDHVRLAANVGALHFEYTGVLRHFDQPVA